MIIKEVKKILLIRLRSIGDLIVITPCTKAVKESYPGSFLSVVVDLGMKDIFLENPYVDEVISFDKNNSSLTGRISFLWGLFSKRFDMVINLHGGPASCVMVMATLAKYRVGGLQKRHHFNWIFNIRIPPFHKVLGIEDGPIHIVKRHLATLKCAGITGKDDALILHVSEKDKACIRQLLSKYNIAKGAGYVCMHNPSSESINKISEEKAASIADAIVSKFGVPFIFTGGKGDAALADRVIKRMSNKGINLAGATTIGELAALYKDALFFIGLDSGPGHVAAAAGTPVISLFGPTSINTWRPWTKKLTIIRKDEMECIGCGAKRCKYGEFARCLEEISIKDIIEAGRKITPVPKGSFAIIQHLYLIDNNEI